MVATEFVGDLPDTLPPDAALVLARIVRSFIESALDDDAAVSQDQSEADDEVTP